MTSGHAGLADLDDVALMASVARGGRDAFTILMRRHEDLVFSVSLRIMSSREAALDATQETFLTVFRKADRFRGEAAFTTWLYRVATNTCYDLLRKQRRRAAAPLSPVHDPPDRRAEDSLDGVETASQIERALARIPADFRTAVVLSDIQGLTMSEIAHILDIPEGTVKSRIFRGRRLLAQILGNLRPGSDPLNQDA